VRHRIAAARDQRRAVERGLGGDALGRQQPRDGLDRAPATANRATTGREMDRAPGLSAARQRLPDHVEARQRAPVDWLLPRDCSGMVEQREDNHQ